MVSMTFAFLTAAFVCMLCNYIIDKTFSWSLYVVGSEIVAWLIVYPFLAGKKHRCVLSLTALTITIMPLLMSLPRKRLGVSFWAGCCAHFPCQPVDYGFTICLYSYQPVVS